ncbi:hypothetical protein HAX54_001182 [Datura stramonium]|uniref:Uncharacterized protein n=1 Tax=Datura stramonium TaxID=4076 RepID=A0ABS8T2P6_DATST|nr:hypothetical protein [Datura stramonium]
MKFECSVGARVNGKQTNEEVPFTLILMEQEILEQSNSSKTGVITGRTVAEEDETSVDLEETHGSRKQSGDVEVIEEEGENYQFCHKCMRVRHVCVEPPNEANHPRKKKVLKQMWKPTEKVAQKEDEQKATKKGIQVEREVNVLFDPNIFPILTATPVRNISYVFAS